MKSRYLKPSLSILFILSIVLQVFLGDCKAQAGNIQLAKNENKLAHWWYTQGVQGRVLDEQNLEVSGQGRIAILADKKGFDIHFSAAEIRVEEPGTLLYLDQYGQQYRIMVLRGKVSLLMNQHRYSLPASLQAMITPDSENIQFSGKKFIFDGVYRRPVLFNETVERRQIIVRQFYLEQLVHIDPLIKAIYHDSVLGKKLVNRLNRSAANLRMLNGVDGYVAKQM